MRSNFSPFVSSRPVRGSRSRRGASLVETVAAIGILTVAMTVLGQFMLEAIRGSAVATLRMQAVLLAQEKMEDIIAHRADLTAWEERALEENPIDVEAKGRRFAEPGREDYRWEWDIADSENPPGMKRITVRTYWEDPHGSHPWVKSELSTLLVLPQ